MEYNIKYKNGYVICTVGNVWTNGVGRTIQESIENFIEDYRGVKYAV